MPLLDLLRDKIKKTGPLTVAEYMELALYHEEHGYYTKRDPFGGKGDFVTSPEISQIFGEMIGVWCAAVWRQMQQPDIALIELGPGRGTLMQDLLRATAHVPGFHDSLCVVMVETSPLLKRHQQAVLHGRHSRIAWQPSLEELPDLPALFIANEFFDALPIRQFVKTPEGLKEKLVDVDDEGKLCFLVKEMGIRLVKGGAYSGDEVIVETCPAARSIAHRMAAQMKTHGGAALMIDYGYSGGSRGNTLQAVKEHGFHSALDTPGAADITAHVDFDALKEIFSEQALPAYGPIVQGEFLKRIGAELRAEILMERADEAQKDTIMAGLKRLTSPAQMGDLFKVLAVMGDARLQPPGFEMIYSTPSS